MGAGSGIREGLCPCGKAGLVGCGNVRVRLA